MISRNIEFVGLISAWLAVFCYNF